MSGCAGNSRPSRQPASPGRAAGGRPLGRLDRSHPVGLVGGGLAAAAGAADLDNLAGHCDWELEQDLLNWGILPLYTPVAGSWLNLAESVQRILIRRALAGHHPQSTQEVKTWLAETVDGWNADPTPFEWGGKRAARRQRARHRRHTVGGSGGYTRRPIRPCQIGR